MECIDNSQQKLDNLSFRNFAPVTREGIQVADGLGGWCFGKSEEDGHSSQLCHGQHGRDVLLSERHFMEILPGGSMFLHMKIFLEV